MTLRSIESCNGNLTVESLAALAKLNDRILGILAYPRSCSSGLSTVAISMKVAAEGFDSWKLHFLELVDEFRRELDPRLILLPPVPELELRLKALLASIVLELSNEAGIDPPDWASRTYHLEEPWFLSGAESLKASALVESPAYYRRNNIFVLENFLKRA